MLFSGVVDTTAGTALFPPLTEEFAAENIRDDIYYVSVPWYEDDEEILDQFEVIEEETVSYRGWDVTVMRLRK